MNPDLSVYQETGCGTDCRVSIRYDLHMDKRPAEDSAALMGCGLLVVMLLLLYFGGWYILWGGAPMLEKGAIWAADNGIAIRINDAYYGIAFRDRWFDAPAISWGALVLAVVCLFSRVK